MRQHKRPYHDSRRILLNNPETDGGKSHGSPLVSVVIICFNQADFLGEAIKSVIKQTYHNIEIIVVDDGSTDYTAEVALGFSDVRYIKQNNQGLSGARNKGIQESKGQYIVFLDADDRLFSAAVESGLNCFRENHDCAFVYGAHKYIKSDGTSFDYTETPQSEQHLLLARLRSEKDQYSGLLKGNYIGMHASVMYKSNIFKSAGGFDTSLDACEDYELYLRIARNYPIRFHEELVAEYRLHGANMTKNPELMLRTVMRVLRSQLKYVKAHNKDIEALRAGETFWIEYYSYDLIRQIKAQLRVRSERIHALRGLFTLMRYTPGCFVKVLRHFQCH